MAYKILILLFIILTVGNIYPEEMCVSCHINQTHYQSKGVCTLCHLGNAYTTRMDLAHRNILNGDYALFLIKDSWKVFKGNNLIEKAACRRCHIIGDKGNTLATNLNKSTREKDIKTLKGAIERPFLFMPQFYFSEIQITYILNALLNNAFYSKAGNEGYTIVHFSKNVKDKNKFDEKCGMCHRMISKNNGPLGTGNRGPNLSGLFTYEFNTIKEVEEWNEKKLRKWIENPRSIKKNALMPPIILKVEEIKEILKSFNE